MRIRVPDGCELKKVSDLREGNRLVQQDGEIMIIISMQDTANKTVFGVIGPNGQLGYLTLSRRRQVCVLMPKAHEVI